MFTKSTDDLNIIQKLADAPNIEDGMSAEQLKAKFDEGVITLQEFINGLINELEAKGSATSLGANSMYDGDTSAPNIQAKLNTLKNMMDELTLGTLPNNSITETKLINEFRNLLAKKNGELQVNLNAEKLGGKKLCSLYATSKYHDTTHSTSELVQITENIMPTMESNSQNGILLSFEKSSSDADLSTSKMYKLFDENYINRLGDDFVWLERGWLVIELPFYVKISKFKTRAYDTDGRANHEVIKLEGKDENGVWRTIASQKGVPSTYESSTDCETTSNADFYTNELRIIAFNEYSDDNSGARLVKINFDGEIVQSLRINKLELNLGFEELEAGQKVSIRVPDEYIKSLKGKMQVDGLGYKELPEMLNPGENITLVYNGEKFEYEDGHVICGVAKGNTYLGFRPKAVFTGTSSSTAYCLCKFGIGTDLQGASNHVSINDTGFVAPNELVTFVAIK